MSYRNDSYPILPWMLLIEGVPSTLTSPPPTLTVGGGDVIVEGGGDRQALVKHEAALERLMEIQKEMVGGEKAG